MIPWDKLSRNDSEKLDAIAKRAVTLASKAGAVVSLIDLTMDITACHLVGCPLDLDKLANFDDYNLGHDVFGIRRYLNRETGDLASFFSPRSSAPTPTTAR